MTRKGILNIFIAVIFIIGFITIYTVFNHKPADKQVESQVYSASNSVQSNEENEIKVSQDNLKEAEDEKS